MRSRLKEELLESLTASGGIVDLLVEGKLAPQTFITEYYKLKGDIAERIQDEEAQYETDARNGDPDMLIDLNAYGTEDDEPWEHGGGAA